MFFINVKELISMFTFQAIHNEFFEILALLRNVKELILFKQFTTGGGIGSAFIEMSKS